jgi:hypothetical protein
MRATQEAPPANRATDTSRSTPSPDESPTPHRPETLVHSTIVEFVRPWLYRKQLDAIYDPARLSLIEASTKAGKTVGCIIWLIEKALFGGGGGRNYWWVAPVGAQAEIAFTRMLAYLPEGTYTAHKGKHTIVLMNGAIIWFKGADRPDSLYGDDVHAAVIDEASRLKEGAWHAVRTTVSATEGPMRIIGNVKGRKNWFYQLARRAQQVRARNPGDLELGYHKITAPDAVAAGVLKQREIDSVRGTIPEHAFRELYMAEPSDDGGNPFGIQHIAKCTVPNLSTAAVAVWGWDLGKRQDYTVGIGLDVVGYTAKFERFQRIPWPTILDNIVRMTASRPALVDSTGLGDPIVDFLQAKPGTKFEGYHFNPASKQKLMEGLAVAIQSNSITFPPGEIVSELEAFEYEHTRTGVRYSAPEGMHDDCVCALALAVMHMTHAPKPLVITNSILARSMRRH